MSLFEFVTVMISMILALCLGHILRATSLLVKTNRRVVFYAPYAIWLAVIFLSVINHWWSLWDLRNHEWDYASFLYILAAPILISFATGTLMPEEISSEQVDLEAQYLRARKVFFLAMTGYGVFMLFDGPLLAGQDLAQNFNLITIVLLMDTIIPVFTANRMINALCGSISFAMVLAVIVTRYLSS